MDVPDNLLYRSEYNHARTSEYKILSVMNSSVAVSVAVTEFRYDRVGLSFVCRVWHIGRLWWLGVCVE
jgi:hypothetical protein